MIVNEHKDQCGIVYCTERATTLDITYCLQTKGVNATYFHGALDPYKKKANFGAREEHLLCVQPLFLEWGLTKPMFALLFTWAFHSQ